MTISEKQGGRNIVRNGIYGFSTWLLPLVLSFIATPVIVRSLGNEDYGVYALVIGFIAYSFNFNVGRAITKYISEYRTVGESEKIREVISATLFINLGLGAAGLLTIFLGARVLVADILNIAAESREKSVLALYAAALTIFFLMLGQVFNAILQGLHRFDVYAKIYNFNNLLLISGNLGLALSGFGLLPLLVWNLSVTALTALISGAAAKKLTPELRFDLKFPRDTLKLVVRYSSGVVAYQVLANVLLLFERGWITSRLGTESLTYYVVPLMLALYIHSFISSLMLVIFPLASELRDDREKLLRLYRKATKIVVFFVVFLGATLVIESRSFLTLWMGSDFAEQSTAILIIHVITFSLLAIEIVAWQMTEGLGYPNLNCFLFMICFLVCLVGFIYLTPLYGGFGAALARLGGFATLFGSIFYVEKRFFGTTQVAFWARLLLTLAVSIAPAVVLEKILSANLGVNWTSLILSSLAGGAVYCLTAWLMGFVTEEEIALLRRIANRQIKNEQEI